MTKKNLIFTLILSILICFPLLLEEFLPGLHKLTYTLFVFTPLLMLFALGTLISIIIILIRKFKKRKQLPLFLSICIIFAFMLVSSAIVVFAPESEFPTGSNLMKFNPDVWKTEKAQIWPENGPSTREKMLKDLVKNVLPGKSRAEIETLLGPSLETDYFQSIDKDLIYYMGPERDNYMALDSEWLLIWLDENGIFQKYKIVND